MLTFHSAHCRKLHNSQTNLVSVFIEHFYCFGISKIQQRTALADPRLHILIPKSVFITEVWMMNQDAQLIRGASQVVSRLAFYSDDPSSNTADMYDFSTKLFVGKNQ